LAVLQRDRGVVLSTQDLNETDRLALLLTRKRGKLPVLMKRARRLESPFGAIVDVTRHVELIYYLRSGPYLLREADLLERFVRVEGDLGVLERALKGLAFVRDLLPERAPEPGLYGLTLDFLRALEAGVAPGVALISYELKSLSLLGHRPHLEGCVSCGAQEHLSWSPEKGGLLCRRCGGRGEEIPPPLWRGMRMLLRLSLDNADRVRLSPQQVREAEGLLRAFRFLHLPS